MNVATESVISLNVAKEFTRMPGPRFRSEGKFSGEEFRESILTTRFEQALKENARLHVDLDGGYGYAPSFLEEAFGGLARKYGQKVVLGQISFKSDEEPLLKEDIVSYMRKAGV